MIPGRFETSCADRLRQYPFELCGGFWRQKDTRGICRRSEKEPVNHFEASRSLELGQMGFRFI